MALSDLTVSGLERYGGVDLKRNYRKFFSEGIVVSIGLHLLVLMLYVAYNFLTTEPQNAYPVKRACELILIRPSILDNDPLPAGTVVATRPPTPNDIPVPVPTLIEPVDVIDRASGRERSTNCRTDGGAGTFDHR
jgi:hypothetical protein